jgi:hypothetical protein
MDLTCDGQGLVMAIVGVVLDCFMLKAADRK